MKVRSSRSDMFLRKGVLKICSIFTGEHPCLSVISIKLLRNFIEIKLRYGCSPVNLLHIFRTPFPRNTSGWLLLTYTSKNTSGCLFLTYTSKNTSGWLLLTYTSFPGASNIISKTQTSLQWLAVILQL